MVFVIDSSTSSGASSAAGSFSSIASVPHKGGKKPLKDMLFHVIGTSLKKDVVKTIRRLGGKGTRSPNDKVVACITTKGIYRSGTVNSKSFVGKVLLRIKWKFELN